MKTNILWLVLFLSQAFHTYATKKSDHAADSIMSCLFLHAQTYGKQISEYKSIAYIKETTHIYKKNFLLRYAPDYFAFNKKDSSSIIETIIEVQYFAPNNFTQKILAINGSNLHPGDINQRAMQFLNINIYNPMAFNDEIFMPTAETMFKYYRFSHEATIDSLGYTLEKIKIEPKIKSQKLISGYIYIAKDLWSVVRIDIHGRWELSTFRIETDFGLNNTGFLLPSQTKLLLNIQLLGNKITSHYTSNFQYIDVKTYDPKDKPKSITYDLSDHFNIKLDSLPVIKDSLFWTENRTNPLTENEQALYQVKQNNTTPLDSVFFDKIPSSWDLAKGIIIPRNFEYNSTQFRYSGLLNPFKLSYSKLDGPVYWQQLKLNKQYDSGRELSFNPDIGFVFKRKEIYVNTPVSYLFNSKKMGRVIFSLGNRNQSYSSKIIDLINKQIPDSINFNDFHLKFYKHYYTSLNAQYELFHGFMGNLGFDYHLYKPVRSGDTDSLAIPSDPKIEVPEVISENYKSFTPVIAIRYTPKQYYKINGKKKEYLWSPYPTFSAEYARGIDGILGSNSTYERIEADIQQKIHLGLLRSIQYYAGAGIFTNTQSIYFADFRKFTKKNFPQSWSDGIGGVFQLLNGNWYNASKLYLQFHLMYESPFVLLQLLKGIPRDILKERFYISQLYTPTLPSYTEIGYGIGNFMGNVGVFVGFEKGEYKSFGFKFTFELGR